ncbi:MAG: T9SS type A sorting domain-containing protein [Bacteroidetes bacterium]|nr:T9SS type A sorting domain-containing protein [Bacteroidota bacterium]
MNHLSIIICSLLIISLHANASNQESFSHDSTFTGGSVIIPFSSGHPLPFDEPWDSGTFVNNEWHHTGNWIVNLLTGNPLPCADFRGQPALSNYSDTLRSLLIDAAPYTCARIWLDYDIKLDDKNHTGNEYLAVEKLAGGFSRKITEYKNEGNVDWTSEHLELTYTIGQTFKIQFRAHGSNSVDLHHWYVDNIHVYASCKPPRQLNYYRSHRIVNLSWSIPNCSPLEPFQIDYDDGTYENGIANPPGYTYSFGNMFVLPPGSNGYLTSFDCFFYQSGTSSPVSLTMDVYDDNYNLLGSSAPFIQGNGVWQNIPVPSIPFISTFYGMVNENGTPTRPNWLGFDDDGPYANTDYGMYYDGAGTWGTIGSLIGDHGVYLERANGLISSKSERTFSIATGQSPYSDNPTTGSLQGYNIFRTDSTGWPLTFHKLNTNLVPSTSYIDSLPYVEAGEFKYYITSVFSDTIDNTFLCESTGSDTIRVWVGWGIETEENIKITVYPNPATDNIYMKSEYSIISTEVMDYTGRIVYSNPDLQGKISQINVSTLNSGIYMVKIVTDHGIGVKKITVRH